MDWNSSALWGIIGSVVSFVITYYFMKHPISKYQIIYKKETSCILSNTQMREIRVKVKHDTCDIDNLYFSKVTILNKGNYKITENDFVANHNIILFTDGEIFPYDFSINVQNKLEGSNDIKLKLKSNNQIEINIILLHPHESFNFSFFHTEEINYSGELNNGKICEYQNHNYKYPVFLSFLICNLVFSFVYMNIPEIFSSEILIIKFFCDLLLIMLYSGFYNIPTDS